MDLRETGIDGENWIQLARLLRTRWWISGFHKESRIFFDKLTKTDEMQIHFWRWISYPESIALTSTSHSSQNETPH
jgi:hypothetical protein